MLRELAHFLHRNPVFTHQMFIDVLSKEGPRSPNTCRNILVHHIQRGHIIRIKRGLFATIPRGADPKTFPVDPYLIAGYSTDDSVIGYQTALAFYGCTYSASYRFIYCTHQQASSFKFRNESLPIHYSRK